MDTNGWKMMAVAGFAALGGMMWTQVLAPRDAVGYPSGAAVSYGANPVFSAGGSIDFLTGGSATATIGSAGSDAVITDVVLSVGSNQYCVYGHGEVVLSDSTGQLAKFAVGLGGDNSTGNSLVVIPLNSGIRVAGGADVQIALTSLHWGHSCTASYSANLYYTLSGYYAEP